MTKFTRIVLLALMLTVVLAVSSFAEYSFNLDGTVNGLEDGVEYTVAEYDFAANAYGEWTELDGTTQLTPGVWGIKAGDAKAETVFISGANSGHITFWNLETNLPVNNFAGVNDNLVPGKWSVSTNGAFRTVQAYVGTTQASACLYLQKAKYLKQVEGSWINATPITGEDNKLQESVVRYGFANDQIVPANAVNSIPNDWLTIQTGGNAINKDKGYTEADIKGTFTFVVKVPEAEDVEKYVVAIDAVTVGRTIAAPAEMAESDGYLIGFEFAPYVNTPDDIFVGSATDKAAECYAHYGLKKGINVIDFDNELPAAPAGVVDGFGTIGGLEDGKFMVAPATINADGNGLAIGEWEEFDPEIRAYAGLYAVKEVYGERESAIAYAYAYGSYEDRKAIGATLGTGENPNTVLVTGGQKFYPGQYSGHYTQYWTGTAWQIMSHGQVDASYLDAAMNARKAYEALVADETATEDAIAAAKATLDAKNTAFIDKLNAVNLRYAYAPEEIIPTELVNSFRITAFQDNGGFTLNGNQDKRFVAYVADKTGKITTYEKTITQAFNRNLDFTVDFSSFLPEEGYLMAFQVYPCTNVTLENFGKVTSPYSFRYYTKVLPSNYSIDEPVLPKADKPTGLEYADGKVIGLDENENYKYAQFNINGIADSDYVDVEDGATEFEIGDMVGLIAVCKKGDGIYTTDSLPAYVYVPAAGYDNILHTQTIVADGGANKDKEIDVPVIVSASNDGIVHFNAGKWTGISLDIGLQKTHNLAPLILGSTSCPGGSGTALKNAQDALAALGEDATADEIAEKTANLESERAKTAAKIASQYFSYAYLPNEIIPMSDFVSYKYGGPRVRQSGYAVGSGTVYTKFVFKVVNDNGELVDREVLKPVTFSWNATTTISASDFTETDGYIVGIVIYPFGYIDGYYNGVSGTHADFNVELLADGYKVNRTLLPAKMTKLEVENGVVSGFSDRYTYEYASYGINGVIGEWTDVEGDEFALVNTGLTAIRIKTDSVTYAASAPQVFYNAGNYSDRTAIFEYDENDALVNVKGNDFIVGTFVAPRLSYLNDSSVGAKYAGANVTLDQQVGGYGNVGAAEKLWLLQHTKEEAQAALDAEASHQGDYNQTEGHDGSYYPARLQGVIDAHYAQAHDIPAEIKAITDNLVNNYSKSYIRYALAEDEILPVGELKTLKFLNKTRQGAFEFKAQTRVNVYVMDENGVVTPYDWTSDFYSVARHTNYYHTVDVQNMIDLPETGWVVGIEFIPYAVIDGSSVKSVANARIAYKAQAWAFDQQHVVMGFYYDSYEIVKPAIDKPDYIEYANGKFTGLLADETYAYGRFTANGVEEVTEITGVTELAVPGVGVWGIQLVTDNKEEFSNSGFVVGYKKDKTNARDSIIHLVDYTKTNGDVIQVPAVAGAGSFSTTASVVFNEAKWTGFSLVNALVNHGFGAMTLGTTSCTVPASYPNAIKDATNDVSLDAARVSAANAIAKVYYSYEYTAAEAIPMNEFISWSFDSRERQGSLKVTQGSLQTKFVFKVVTEDGIVEDRVVYKNAKFDGSGSKITVNINDFEETDGYIVGIVIYPYGNCPEGTILDSDGATTAEDIIVILGNDYTVVPAMSGEAAETPVLSLTTNNAVITVTNYNAAANYAYSTDGGETWVEFEGASFNATKASTEYVVKALEGEFFGESEVSEPVTSPAATLVGTSLVLDGQIGIKVYLDIDMDLVSSLTYYTTKINDDYKNVDASKYREGDYVTLTRSSKWQTPITLDEETGLYYTIIYIPAKDVDNTSFEVDMGIYLKSATSTRIPVNSIGHSFTKYIAEAKALAAAGDATFAEALPLVEALEAYVNYADNYFNNGDDVAYVSTASMDGIAAPVRNNATLVGVEFYGTSLLLEDQVTIRHYFKVIDLNAFNETYNVEGAYGTKGNFIYFDTPDISAQDIGTAKSFALEDKEGIVKLSIFYSVANYIKDMADSDDINLASLVNAMYDYYLAAADYTK